MLKTILGSAIGGLMAGAVVLGVSAFTRPMPAPMMGVDPNNPYAMTVAYTGVPGQGAAAMVARPAYYAPQPNYSPDMVSMPVQRARTVARPVAAREPVVYREDDRREGRSWGKTAMIIGGGAATIYESAKH